MERDLHTVGKSYGVAYCCEKLNLIQSQETKDVLV